MNDDVLPIQADWLKLMVAHMSDAAVAAVGAKLLYEDRSVQHAGVIMGLAGLCEHAFRHLAEDDPGYAGRALLDQEFSAVTAACLLIRSDVFRQVGGMDETFASEFNDVDLCMKIRARGWLIVWSAHARLFHYESLSFGHHYAGERAPRELIDIRLMLNRWHEVCEDDPVPQSEPIVDPGQRMDPGVSAAPCRPAEIGRRAGDRRALRPALSTTAAHDR